MSSDRAVPFAERATARSDRNRWRSSLREFAVAAPPDYETPLTRDPDLAPCPFSIAWHPQAMQPLRLPIAKMLRADPAQRGPWSCSASRG